MTRLLVSVRDRAEAAVALAGGAALIDVKEPARGPLGRPDAAVVAGILDEVAGRLPVSTALGELADWPDDGLPPHLDRLTFVKLGLANARSGWGERLTQLRQRIEAASPCRVVATAYADWRRAAAPPPAEVGHLAVHHRFAVLLLDTWHKDGSTLLDWMALGDLSGLVLSCHASHVRVALAGSLGRADIVHLAGLRPDWFAVRGAACRQGQRDARLEVDRVRGLVEVVNRPLSAG